MARTWRTVVVVAALVAGSGVVAGCGSDDGDAAASSTLPVADAGPASTTVPAAPGDGAADRTGQSEVTIQARDNSFVPKEIVVAAGARITFENKGRNDHNALPAEEGAFTAVPTDQLGPGESATIVISEPGDYPYYCSLHGTPTAGMIGTIQVR